MGALSLCSRCCHLSISHGPCLLTVLPSPLSVLSSAQLSSTTTLVSVLPELKTHSSSSKAFLLFSLFASLTHSLRKLKIIPSLPVFASVSPV